MLSKTQLADQFALQHQMNSIVNPDWLKAGYAWNRAIMVEAVEALDHYGWKWWKESEPDVAQVQIELVDIWHFVLSATLVGTNGDANWASESIFGRFASAPSSDVAASSTPMLFDILAGDAASGLEKQHLHIRAKGQMPDFLDVFGLPASIRIFLLGWFFLSAFMMLPKLTLMVLGIPVRGSVVFADLWYFGALLLALAGCYFLACEHPPPNARRQPTLAKGRFAWGI